MDVFLTSFYLVASLLSYSQTGQQKQMDSLLAVSREFEGSEYEVDALNKLARLYYFSDTDSTLILAEKARDLSQRLDYKKGTAYALHHIGAYYDNTSQYDSALTYYEKSLKLKQELNDSASISGTFNNIGGIHYFIGNYPLALYYFQESLKIKESLNDSVRMARTLNNIGIVHGSMKNYEQSIAYRKRAMKIREQIGDQAGILSSHQGIGLYYMSIENYEKAKGHLQTAYEMHDSIGAPCQAKFVCFNLGLIYLELGFPDKAMSFFEEEYEVANTCQSQRSMCMALRGFGEIHLNEGKIDLAKKELTEAFGLAKDRGMKEEMETIARLLYEVYKVKANWESALAYYEIAEEIEDELFNKDFTEQVTSLELNYAFEQERDSLEYQKQAELLSVGLQLDRQRYLQYATWTVLMISVVFGGIIYRSFRINRKAKLILQDKNEVISIALNEREVLLREIHHRVKNNLQVVSSLLNIQCKFLNDELARKAVEEGRNRVQSMALVHEKLYQSEDLANIDVKEYLDQLAQTLFRSYNVNEDRVQLSSRIDQVNLEVDTTIHIGLIINELVSNALKHAFPEEREGVISLSLQKIDQKFELEISDNGVGMSAELDLSKSYGYRIVQSICRGLDGTISVNFDHGTKFLLTF